MSNTTATPAQDATTVVEFAPDQPVTVALPGGKSIDGYYTETEDDGRLVVRYEKGGEEKFTRALASKVTAREVAPAPAPAPAAPATAAKRAPLPEGYTTPVGLTNIINERKLYTGENGVLKSQAMYSYVKANGANSEHPFPLEIIDGRQVVAIEAGLAWWVAKDARVAAAAEAAEAKRNAVPSTELRDATKIARTARTASKKANEAFDAQVARVQEAVAKLDGLRKIAIEAGATVAHAELAVAAIEEGEGSAE